MKKYFIWMIAAILTICGAVMTTSCSSHDNPASGDKYVTATFTASFESVAQTRAISENGDLLFATDDKVAVLYENTSGEMVKAVSNEVATPGPTATFTITMVNPKANGNLQCLYPASMASDEDVTYDALFTEQDGTLDTFNKKFHLALYKGNLTADAKVPSSIELVNRLAISNLTVKEGDNDITSAVTKLVVKYGESKYSLSTASVSPIWLGLIPVEDSDIIVYAAKGDDLFMGSIPGPLKAGSPQDITVNVTKLSGAPVTDIDSIDDYTFLVTVNVTRQGDDATTHATDNDDTKELSFSEGDQLFVRGLHHIEGSLARFAGTLKYVSEGTFSGIIYTQKPFSGTADALLPAPEATATLLPAGYDTHGYLSISGSGATASISSDASKAFATSKAVAVEQFSHESAWTYSSGFTLSPRNAILNFTITGLTPSANFTATLKKSFYDRVMVTGSAKTDDSGNATFAMAVPGGYDLNELSLTVGGIDIPLSSTSKVLEAGHIYDIDRTSPIAPSTVTWNSSNVFNLNHVTTNVGKNASPSATFEGITISFSGSGSKSAFHPYLFPTGPAVLYVVKGDSYTFTAPTGKKFTKIEIIDNDNVGIYFEAYDDYWTKPKSNKIVWSGPASSTVTLGGSNSIGNINCATLNSIVFTMIEL